MSTVPATTTTETVSFWKKFKQEGREKPTQFLALIAQTTSLFVSITSLMLTVAGLVFVYFQIMNVKEQIVGLRNSLDMQSYSAINTQMSEIDKVFIDQPTLRPYFYKKQPWPDSDEMLRNKLTSVAERKLDFIDFWFTSARHLSLDEYDMVSWRNYFIDSFRNSRILCDVLTDEQSQYGEEIRSIAFKSGKCPGVRPVSLKSLQIVEEYFPPRRVFSPTRP
ncbi:MAG TPA: hypothetical protein VJS47_13555 [Rhizomicrobium sp.]|nr:hypothetical protein [Rhizomicrobium sp.]